MSTLLVTLRPTSQTLDLVSHHNIFKKNIYKYHINATTVLGFYRFILVIHCKAVNEMWIFEGKSSWSVGQTGIIFYIAVYCRKHTCRPTHLSDRDLECDELYGLKIFIQIAQIL